MSFSKRFAMAREAGLSLPNGPAVVFGATAQSDLTALPDAMIVSRDARVHARWPSARAEAIREAACAVVLLSREKARSQSDLYHATRSTSGPILVDGQKTDGVEPMLKALRKRGAMHGPLSKAHGKLFWSTDPLVLEDWQPHPISVDGMQSWPGVFSAGHVDAGSALLAEALPARLGASTCDLGAGWGWLSAQVAARTESLHMVETDGWALDCAARNVPSAVAHWADVTTWTAPRLFDCVVMNPPFHEDRKGVPDLGVAFIAKAAEILTSNGHLYMVANRHLPYEEHLAARFAKVEDFGGDTRYKVFHTEKPASRPRTRSVSRSRR